MHEARDGHASPGTTGRVLHWALGYDLLVSLFMAGTGEGKFRERLLDLAGLRTGETVLDAGCGTGTLAIAAARRVGPSGRVHGVDASPSMIVRAARKSRRAGVAVDFRIGVAESLPYADGSFDVVLSTLMLHHLPREPRERFAREMRRVLTPRGRVLVVDFGAGVREQARSLVGHFHRHGHLPLRDIVDLLGSSGLHVVESGAVGMKDLHFVSATPA